jgi:DNA-binding transcriptional LysR family regulator
MKLNFRPRTLQLLVALDDYRNVGKVAASSNVTQPAVSKALSELERAVGLKLFERGPRGLRPTRYGECLVRHARAVLSRLTQAQEELDELSGGEVRHVRIGAGGHAAVELLPRAMALLKERSPATTVHVRVDAMRLLLPELWSGELDVIVGRLPHVPYPGIAQRVLTDRALTLVVRPGHPLARYRRLRWQQLAPYPWVLPPAGTPLRAQIERAFEVNGLRPAEDLVETLSIGIICNYLAQSDAIGVLASQVSRHYRRAGLLHVLPLDLPQAATAGGVLWNQQRSLPVPAKLLVECLEKAAGRERVAPA